MVLEIRKITLDLLSAAALAGECLDPVPLEILRLAGPGTLVEPVDLLVSELGRQAKPDLPDFIAIGVENFRRKFAIARDGERRWRLHLYQHLRRSPFGKLVDYRTNLGLILKDLGRIVLASK